MQIGILQIGAVQRAPGNRAARGPIMVKTAIRRPPPAGRAANNPADPAPQAHFPEFYQLIKNFTVAS
ncbi:hypothetical protein [Paracoccus sp. (in: a-proteobacteria)]|uniref:hypothetical protein n=1 Tax=Paracoccus sp. TaxID=267 RepID=UPI0035B095D4